MDDLGQTIEEEVQVPVEAVEPPSLRDSLASALEESKARQEEKTIEPKAEKPRAEDGKFAKAPKEPKVKAVSQETIPQVKIEEQAISIPKSISSTLGKEWATVPKSLQQAIAKREEDYHKELTKHDEERNFGRQIQSIATPYLPLIKAEGGDLVRGYEQYLNTAYILRTKSPQEKGALILKLAQEFGADLRGATQQAQQPINPVLQQLQQEIASLKGQMTQEKTQKEQQEAQALESQVEAFKSDPKHIHFETVKAHMAALLRGGAAKDLEDAYDQAVYANPHTRSTLLEQNTKSVEEQRVADKKAKADAAKKAGSSIKGAPGMAATKNGTISQSNLREALKSAFAEHRA